MSARLKFWRRSRVPKKGSREEAVGISRGFAARDGSAVKCHSTILQRLRRQISLDYYTIPPATQAMLSLVLQKRFTQSKFRMIHALCSASNLRARAEKIKKPLFKQTHKVTFHIITSLGVVFSLSTLISKLSRAKIIGSFKLQVSL